MYVILGLCEARVDEEDEDEDGDDLAMVIKPLPKGKCIIYFYWHLLFTTLMYSRITSTKLICDCYYNSCYKYLNVSLKR